MTFPLPGSNYTYTHGLRLVASTGVAGYALQNASPVNVMTWTAPNDGQLHRVIVTGSAVVTSAVTGGQIQVKFTAPSGAAASAGFLAANTGVLAFGIQPGGAIVKAGSTVTLTQISAATAGAGTAWAEFWAA